MSGKLPRFEGDNLLLTPIQFESMSRQAILGEKHYGWSANESTYHALWGIGLSDSDIRSRMHKKTNVVVVPESDVDE